MARHSAAWPCLVDGHLSHFGFANEAKQGYVECFVWSGFAMPGYMASRGKVGYVLVDGGAGRLMLRRAGLSRVCQVKPCLLRLRHALRMM
jgi:hypothetical protein